MIHSPLPSSWPQWVRPCLLTLQLLCLAGLARVPAVLRAVRALFLLSIISRTFLSWLVWESTDGALSRPCLALLKSLVFASSSKAPARLPLSSSRLRRSSLVRPIGTRSPTRFIRRSRSFSTAFTGKGCKDPKLDPHAELGDAFQKGLTSWCRTKKAASIFFWISFGKGISLSRRGFASEIHLELARPALWASLLVMSILAWRRTRYTLAGNGSGSDGERGGGGKVKDRPFKPPVTVDDFSTKEDEADDDDADDHAYEAARNRDAFAAGAGNVGSGRPSYDARATAARQQGYYAQSQPAQAPTSAPAPASAPVLGLPPMDRPPPQGMSRTMHLATYGDPCGSYLTAPSISFAAPSSAHSSFAHSLSSRERPPKPRLTPSDYRPTSLPDACPPSLRSISILRSLRPASSCPSALRTASAAAPSQAAFLLGRSSRRLPALPALTSVLNTLLSVHSCFFSRSSRPAMDAPLCFTYPRSSHAQSASLARDAHNAQCPAQSL